MWYFICIDNFCKDINFCYLLVCNLFWYINVDVRWLFLKFLNIIYWRFIKSDFINFIFDKSWDDWKEFDVDLRLVMCDCKYIVFVWRLVINDLIVVRLDWRWEMFDFFVEFKEVILREIDLSFVFNWLIFWWSEWLLVLILVFWLCSNNVKYCIDWVMLFIFLRMIWVLEEWLIKLRLVFNEFIVKFRLFSLLSKCCIVDVVVVLLIFSIIFKFVIFFFWFFNLVFWVFIFVFILLIFCISNEIVVFNFNGLMGVGVVG